MSLARRVALVERLWDHTVKGKIEWKPSEREGACEIVLSSYRIQIGTVTLRGEVDYLIQVGDDNGRVVESFAGKDLANKPSIQKKLRELFERAHRRPVDAETVLETILNELGEERQDV